MKLFTLVNGDIVINKIEILTLAPFKKILKRDKDRFKHTAFKELCYVYHVADPKSIPNTKGYSESEKHKYAITKSNLDKDWTVDDTLKEAIKLYKDEHSSIAKDTITELLKTFRFTNKVIIKVRTSIEELLNGDKLSKEQATEVLNLIETSIRLGRDIPKLTRELNTAVNELYEDDNDDVVLLRGSKKPVPMSADPDADF